MARTWRMGIAFVVVATLIDLASANLGYDMEEIPTGQFKGYCVELDWNQPSGLCQKKAGRPKVCAVSKDGDGNPSAAMTWYEEEVFNRKAPHTDKALEEGGQSFDFLKIFLNNWACKQIGETVRVRTDLTERQKTDLACDYVWRRDQEIQNGSSAGGAVPTEGSPWGTFTYKPPGKNLTTFTFKGIPKNQCEHDRDCRGFNNPGQVYVCCDYCEKYFLDMCEITRDQAFQFCMEKAHCVCNSVSKGCAQPVEERCPSGRCVEGTPWNRGDGQPIGAYYPLHGAPCSGAVPAAARSPSLAASAGLAAFVLARLAYR